MIEIKINVPKEITFLAGNGLGRDICEKQIAPILIGEKKLIIEIPEHVKGVSIGFVQGLKHGLMEYDENIEVSFKANDKRLEQKLMKDYNF